MLEYERVVVLCIWRKTYGWSKKEDWISNSQIFEETGIVLPNITRTVKSLVEKKVLIRNGKKLGVNKRYNEWIVEWRKLSHQITKVISPDNKKLSHQIPTKERKKLYKKNSESTDSQELLDNDKDMGFNRYAEDYEAGVIDIDGDGTLKEEKKPQTKKYPNAPAVRKVFQEVLGKNPANWKVNKVQLQSCENLYTERGIDKVRSALQFYLEVKDNEYTPQITSPYDLDSKYEKLAAIKRKTQ